MTMCNCRQYEPLIAVGGVLPVMIARAGLEMRRWTGRAALPSGCPAAGVIE